MPKLLKSSYFFPLQVTVDDREPDSLEEELRRKGNMIVHRKRLLAGDYLFDADLLVERKTIPDLCHSIRDGRLFGQAKKLANSRVPACFILEGKKRDFKETDFSPEAIQGILLSISLAFKLPILRTKNTKETVRVMLQGFKQLTKTRLGDQRPCPRASLFKKRKEPLLSQKIHVLAGFPDIGAERAKRLLKVFGNLQAVLAADFKELIQIPGIGEKTAHSLIKILKSRSSD